MDYVTFYNSTGRPVAWIANDSQSIYLFDGTPVAWIADDAVYSYSGRYLGWLQNGWVWDRTGHAVFFTQDAQGGPSRPSRASRPRRLSPVAAFPRKS